MTVGLTGLERAFPGISLNQWEPINRGVAEFAEEDRQGRRRFASRFDASDNGSPFKDTSRSR